PLMPFITEEIWLKAAAMLGITSDSIMLQAWPEQVASAADAGMEAEIAWLQGLITAIRNIRGELNVSPAKTIPVLLNKAGVQDRAWLEQNQQTLRKLARLESLECLEPGASVPPAAMQLSGALEILVPLAGLVDVKAETARLGKEIDKLQAEIDKVRGQLANERFVANAPEAVVSRERERLAAAEASLLQLRQQQEKLAAL